MCIGIAKSNAKTLAMRVIYKAFDLIADRVLEADNCAGAVGDCGVLV